MAIDTRNKRASTANLFLPFGRVGPNPDGSDLATSSEREQAGQGYAFALTILIGGGVDSASKRASAVNLFLPFGRVGVAADSSGLNTAGERTWASQGYAGDIGSVIPTSYEMQGVSAAQNAAAGGQLTRVPKVPFVRPAPKVTCRSMDWDAIVSQADGMSSRTPRPYPVYVFGGGEQRRSFFENV